MKLTELDNGKQVFASWGRSESTAFILLLGTTGLMLLPAWGFKKYFFSIMTENVDSVILTLNHGKECSSGKMAKHCGRSKRCLPENSGLEREWTRFRKSQFCLLTSSLNAATPLCDMLGLGMASQGILAYLTTTSHSYIDGPAGAVTGHPLTWLAWLTGRARDVTSQLWEFTSSQETESGYPFFLFFHFCFSSSLQTGSGCSSWDRCKNRKLSGDCGVVGLRTDSNPWPLLSLFLHPLGVQ